MASNLTPKRTHDFLWCEQITNQFYVLFRHDKEDDLFDRCRSVLERCHFNTEIINLAKRHRESTPEAVLETLRKLQNIRSLFPYETSLIDSKLVKKYLGFAGILKGYTQDELVGICRECQGNKSLFSHLHSSSDEEDSQSRNDLIIRIVSKIGNLMTFSELSTCMSKKSLTLHDLDKFAECSLSQRDIRWKIRFGEEFSEVTLTDRCYDKPPRSNWINYTVRNPEFILTFRYGWQPLYGHMMQQSVVLASECLNVNTWDIKDLLDFIAYCRSTIAHTMNHPPVPDRFGRKRSPSKISESPLVPVYSKLAETLYQLRDSPYFQVSPESSHETLRGIKGRFIYEDLILEEVLIIYNSSENSYSGKVTHTRSQYFDQIYAKLQTLYLQYSTFSTYQERMEILGQIFWWVCRGKFWSRGDRSIAEGVIRAMYMHVTGMDLPPWREGLIPFVEVMIQPEPVLFGRNFANLFDQYCPASSSE